MKKILLTVLLVALTMSAAHSQKNYELKNANWFNGQGFETTTWYVSAGKFTRKAPAQIDSVIDLTDKWITPPLGDVFSAGVAENPSADQVLGMYMSEGVMYLQSLGNTQAGRNALQSKVNVSGSPDFLFSNGAITCTLGAPFLPYESAAQGIRNPAQINAKIDEIKLQRKAHGDGYWFIDNKEALKKLWPAIMAQRPGVISIYLLDAANSGGKENKGLTPDMAKAVVKKAHKSKLRVWAHIETLEDFRLAQKLGVDGIANLPGNNWDGVGEAKRFELSDDDIKLLVKKKTAVSPLFSMAMSATPRPQVTEFHRYAFKRLLDAGVNLVIGSNDTQRTIRTELNYWFQMGGMDHAKVIKVLCENTPQAIFPNRKIGRIAEGYEASFLVLKDNPGGNALKLRIIEWKMKNGAFVK